MYNKSKKSTELNENQKLISCQICGRAFTSDRIDTHKKICQKLKTRLKRTTFDSAKQRVAGTDMEDFKKNRSRTPDRKRSHFAPAPAPVVVNGIQTTHWRQRHKELVASVRNARAVQQYLAKGGKASDLPPPPPSENPDYIQCPYCMRRFNPEAGARHIPQCANYQHNKPNPNIKRRTKA